MRSTERPSSAAASAVAAFLVLLATGAVHATSAKHPILTRLHPSMYIDGSPEPGKRVELKAGQTITLDKNGRVRFTVVDGGVEVTCTLWSKPVAGNVQVQPQAGVGLSFNGGTSLCSTPHPARK